MLRRLISCRIIIIIIIIFIFMPTSTKPVDVNIKEKCKRLQRRLIRWTLCFGRRPHSPVEGPWTGAGTETLFPWHLQ